MWQSGFPDVVTAEATPCSETPRNVWGWVAALMAFTAATRSPVVVFLNPSGIESPDAIWRWVWLSVVRAPMADHEMRSAMYCGVMGSRSSVAVGSPRSMISLRNVRAFLRPVAMSSVPSRFGSMMSPFQPTVVRGFSK